MKGGESLVSSLGNRRQASSGQEPSGECTGNAVAPCSERQNRGPAKKTPPFLAHLGITLLVLAIILGVGRALLPWALRDYVNRTLDRNQLYSDKIGAVEVHLLRGAYSIRDITISKTTGNVPVPFFAAKRVDFAVQWNALIRHKIVGRLLMDKPELNFVDAPTAGDSQTGAGGPWLQNRSFQGLSFDA